MTSTRTRRIVATTLAVLAAFSAGCGGNDDDDTPDDAASASSTTTTEAPPATNADGTPAATTTTAVPAQGATTTAPGGTATTAPGGQGGSTTSTTRGTIPPGSFKVTVTFSKKCVAVGGTQKITVKGKPNAVVTYVSEYSDGESHENNGGGLANGDGVFVDEYLVDPGAPKGKVRVTATVSTRDSGVGFAEGTFTVGC
ncbi:MAG TPA: hypothetical protein VF230_16935 [Acidimicrobiales bacterium]